MVRVLVVDDSAVAREFMVRLLSSDPSIQVVGTASDGIEAVESVRSKQPDLVTMDIHMPRMDGPSAVRQIMQSDPVPIVIVSGNPDARGVQESFRLIESGALAVLPRPDTLDLDGENSSARELLQTIKLMAEVKVVRRWSRAPSRKLPAVPEEVVVPRPGLRIVAIGASTGGPAFLKTILSSLSKDFPVPIVIVQHIAPGFLHGLNEWLNETSKVKVKVAANGETAASGVAYVAPDGGHLTIAANGVLTVTVPREATPHVPSVSVFFESVARAFGPRAIGVLLSGMGRDGADGLLEMRSAGAFTIAQDKATSVVHGMPGEAIRLGAAMQVLPIEKIASSLLASAIS